MPWRNRGRIRRGEGRRGDPRIRLGADPVTPRPQPHASSTRNVRRFARPPSSPAIRRAGRESGHDARELRRSTGAISRSTQSASTTSPPGFAAIASTRTTRAALAAVARTVCSLFGSSPAFRSASTRATSSRAGIDEARPPAPSGGRCAPLRRRRASSPERALARAAPLAARPRPGAKYGGLHTTRRASPR